METIVVHNLVDGMEKIVSAHNGEWYDLRAAEDYALNYGEFKLIHLGVTIKLPKGYEAIMAPRSSTFKKYGVLMTNGIGVIDNKYCGPLDEWMFPVYATRKAVIHKNDRICQFRIVKQQPGADFLYSDEPFSEENRGGLGSTGTN